MRRTTTVAACALILAASVYLFSAQTRLSPVNDEPANIPTGYVFLKTGRMADPTHPPLARYLMSVPLWFLDPSPMAGDPDLGRDWHPFGRRFLFQNDRTWREITWASRSMVIATAVALLVLVFHWVRRLWGGGAAIAAVAFLAFEPTFLGHGNLATLDVPAALGFFGTVYAYWAYRTNPGLGRFSLFALALGLAWMTKFSSGVLFVAIPCIAALGRSRLLPSLRARAAILVGVVGLVSAASYGFQFRRMNEDPQILHTRESAAIARGIEQVARALGTDRESLMDLPIPLYDLAKGTGLQVVHAAAQDLWEDADFYQYLNGEYSRNGWRTYYLWTFLWKSTLPTILLVLALIATGVALAVSRGSARNAAAARVWPFLLVPPLAHFAACSFSTIAIGHRYLMPIVPFLAVGAGWLWVQAGSSRLARGLIVLAILWHAGSSVAVWPRALAYFNEVAGGPANAWRHLADSNVDWGQDLLALQEDVQRTRSAGFEVFGDVFGTVRPEDLGFALPKPPESGPPQAADRVVIYLSFNRWLLRSRLHPDGLYPWLRAAEPSRIVGASIAVFEPGSPRSSRSDGASGSATSR